MITIALSTELTPGTELPLLTAAALAARSGGRLVTVHATTAHADDPRVSPRITDLAQRWQVAIEHVPMIEGGGDDLARTVLAALSRVQPSLVVTGTQGRSGWQQLFGASVAESIARRSTVPTLIVPERSRPVVDERVGTLDFGRMLLPIGDAEAARAGVHAASWLAGLAKIAEIELVLLWVNDGPASLPEAPAAPPGLRFTRRTAGGPLDAAILRVAEELDVGAVVMPTRGRDRLLDAVTGSNTERVVRQARCPVLSVPIG